MRVGVISDTHGLLRPEAEARLAGSAHIIHAGDIGSPEIVPRLRRLAPVTAVRGNVDLDGWALAYPQAACVELRGRAIRVLHDLAELRLDPVACGFSVVIAGHSHRPRIETVAGVLYLNPGSAGRRRFNLPVTVATMELTEGGIEAVIHELL